MKSPERGTVKFIYMKPGTDEVEIEVISLETGKTIEIRAATRKEVFGKNTQGSKGLKEKKND